MPSNISPKISVAIPDELLKHIDRLAKRDYSTRSDVIRVALAEYIRQPRNTESYQIPQEHLEILKQHPFIDPRDTILIELMIESNKNKETTN